MIARFQGAALDGVRYEPPFGYIPAAAYGERGHSVLLADFVTATTAPAWCTPRSPSARTTTSSACATA